MTSTARGSKGRQSAWSSFARSTVAFAAGAGAAA